MQKEVSKVWWIVEAKSDMWASERERREKWVTCTSTSNTLLQLIAPNKKQNNEPNKTTIKRQQRSQEGSGRRCAFRSSTKFVTAFHGTSRALNRASLQFTAFHCSSLRPFFVRSDFTAILLHFHCKSSTLPSPVARHRQHSKRQSQYGLGGWMPWWVTSRPCACTY